MSLPLGTRAGWRKQRFVAFLIAVIAITTPAESTSVEYVKGEASTTEVQSSGSANITSPRMDAMHLLTQANAPVNGQWSLRAQALTVFWNQSESVGVGWAPTNPHEGFTSVPTKKGTGSDRYIGAEVSFARSGPNTNFLVVKNQTPIRVEVESARGFFGNASAGETWYGGASTANYTDSPSVTYGRGGAGQSVIEAGTPVFRFNGSNRIEVTGNFTVFVWSTFINVTDERGNQASYRSGTWDANAILEQVHPRGVAREQHSQVVKLEATDANLVIHDWTDPSRLAAEAIDSETTDVMFRDARAYFESPNHFFQATNATFGFEGALRMKTSAAEGSARLLCSFIGQVVDTDLPPSGPIAPAEALPSQKGQVVEGHEQAATIGSHVPGGAVAVLWSILGFVAIIIGLFALRCHSNAKTRKVVPSLEVLAQLGQAEKALLEGDSRAARRLAKAVLARDATNTHAWFLHGASLVKEKAFQATVEALEPIMNGLPGNRAGLAFLLSLCHLRLRRPSKAARWALMAATDPAFRHQMQIDEQFLPLHNRLGFRAVERAKDVPDVSYG